MCEDDSVTRLLTCPMCGWYMGECAPVKDHNDLAARVMTYFENVARGVDLQVRMDAVGSLADYFKSYGDGH